MGACKFLITFLIINLTEITPLTPEANAALNVPIAGKSFYTVGKIRTSFFTDT